MGSGEKTDETEETEIGLLRRAAHGDTDAAIDLAYHCAAIADNGPGDRVIATIEGLTFARLAAVRGNVIGMGQLISFCGRMIDICDHVSRPDLAAHYRGEALALADLAADLLPPADSDALTTGLTVGANQADAHTLECAGKLRALWAEVFDDFERTAKK